MWLLKFGRGGEWEDDTRGPIARENVINPAGNFFSHMAQQIWPDPSLQLPPPVP